MGGRGFGRRGHGLLCFALPFFRKVDLKKDGGGFETGSPLEELKKFIKEQETKSEAARTELFKQTQQQVGALSAQFEQSTENWQTAPPVKTKGRKALKATNEEPTLADIKRLLPPVKVSDDQQKGRFDGKEEANGRRIEARVKPSAINKDWLSLTLRVQSIDGKPLAGAYVYFFLHETFTPDTFRVPIDKSGKFAELEISTYGAFTVGAIADRGKTKLEIDLATSKSVEAPQWWRDL